MASTSATQIVVVISSAIIPATIIVSCDEEGDIDFMSQFEIELGSQETSNVDLDGTWETLVPKLVANQSLWSASHQSSTYWPFFVVNNDVATNICNL